MNETFLQQLRRLSIERAKNGFKTYDNQPITYWTTAIVGELGELCNMIKKMKRAENGGHDSGHSYTAKSITPKMLREEVGGTLIYIDLLCSILGIDLQEAITETFNEKSVELGFPYLLESTPPVSAMEDETEKIFKPYCIDFFSKESEEEIKIKIGFAFDKKDEAFAIFQNMYHDDYGSINIDENLVSIHTGGWSENEYLISIFKKTEWWRQNFRIQITGGHYYFDTDRINGIKEWDITKRITTPTK